METFLRIDINIIAIFLLFTVYSMAKKRLDKKDKLNIEFLKSSKIIIIQLIIETSTCIINKRSGNMLIIISYFLHVLLFSVAPLLAYNWYRLVKNLIFPQIRKNKFEKVGFIIPVIINFVLTVLSFRYHLVFYIDQKNVYNRGSLFLIFVIITYFYFIITFFYIIKYRKRILKREFNLFFLFGILPLLGGVIQGLIYGPLLMWSTAAFSLVLVYTFLQQRMVHIDSLTGAWDRSSFEHYMSTKLCRDNSIKTGLIYVDVDELKKINDKYGHIEGDYVIKESIACIKRVLRKNDIIVRMGGDEFIVIVDCQRTEEIEKIIKKMEASIELYNQNLDKEYQISCSFGGGIYDNKEGSVKEFLNHIDGLMYQNKVLKKDAKAKE